MSTPSDLMIELLALLKAASIGDVEAEVEHEGDVVRVVVLLDDLTWERRDAVLDSLLLVEDAHPELGFVFDIKQADEELRAFNDAAVARYREMTFMDETPEEGVARACRNAAGTPLTRKTW